MKTYRVWFTDGSSMRIDAYNFAQAQAIAETLETDEAVIMVDMVRILDVYA